MLHQLPHELYIHVLEYAAERMNPIVIRKLPSIITKYKMYKHCENYYKIDGFNSLPYYLYDHLYDDEHIFNVLNQCNCCKRHQKNRARSLTEHYVHIDSNPFYDALESTTRMQYQCDCPCRHWGRMIHIINVVPDQLALII